MKKIYQSIVLIIFILISIISFSSKAKDYDNRFFVCADEVGPMLEFLVPDFKGNSMKKNFSLKVYEINNRKLVFKNDAVIQKKKSLIDDSYFFYVVKYNSKDIELKSGYFEFYPPSHLIMKNQLASFNNLVCWEEKI